MRTTDIGLELFESNLYGVIVKIEIMAKVEHFIKVFVVYVISYTPGLSSPKSEPTFVVTKEKATQGKA